MPTKERVRPQLVLEAIVTEGVFRRIVEAQDLEVHDWSGRERIAELPLNNPEEADQKMILRFIEGA